MATPTISTHPKPQTARAGTKVAEAVRISSNITNPGGLVEYQIRNFVDRSNIFLVDQRTKANNIVSVSKSELVIILPFRTRYQVRVKDQFDNDWGSWVTFKTRSKRYQTPDAIATLTDDRHTKDPRAATERNTQKHGGKWSIIITNESKSVEKSAIGVHGTGHNTGGTIVYNSDFGFNDVTSIKNTNKGATVNASVSIKKTSRGVKIINN